MEGTSTKCPLVAKATGHVAKATNNSTIENRERPLTTEWCKHALWPATGHVSLSKLLSTKGIDFENRGHEHNISTHRKGNRPCSNIEVCLGLGTVMLVTTVNSFIRGRTERSLRRIVLSVSPHLFALVPARGRSLSSEISPIYISHSSPKQQIVGLVPSLIPHVTLGVPARKTRTISFDRGYM